MRNEALKFLKQESETIQLGQDDKGIPLIACWILDDVHCGFWCRFCKKLHRHGIGNGYRGSHCNEKSPYDENYYLVIQGDLREQSNSCKEVTLENDRTRY